MSCELQETTEAELVSNHYLRHLPSLPILTCEKPRQAQVVHLAEEVVACTYEHH